MQFSELERRELIALEEAMWRPETRFDADFQQQRFAEDFLEFGRSGRVYRRHDAIRVGYEPIAARLPLLNLELRRLDIDTAQITYDSEVTYDGQIERAHRSSIWSRTAHGWVMRFHQGTAF